MILCFQTLQVGAPSCGLVNCCVIVSNVSQTDKSSTKPFISPLINAIGRLLLKKLLTLH